MSGGVGAVGEVRGGPADDAAARLFAGPGELRARCRALDWGATPLGAVEGWPQSLRTAVTLCLASSFPTVVMWGPELVQLYNDAYRAVLQAKHPAALGQRARDCWPELWGVVGPLCEEVLDTGASVFVEDQLLAPERRGERAAAEQAYFTISCSAIPEEAGRPAGIVATVLETTRHVRSRGERERALERANAALRESEARFRLTADAVPQIVWITDGQGRTEFFNRQWTAYTGAPYEPGTAVQIAADFVHPDDAAITLERFEVAQRTGGVFEVEHRIRSAQGEYRWFLVRAEPYRDPETGEIVRWFGGSVDIDDRRRAEAERERLLAAERAARAEADAARATAVANERRLAAVIAHLPVGVTFAEAPGGRHSVSNPAAVAIWGVVPASPGVDAYSRDFVGFRPGAPGVPEAARRIASEEWPLARALLTGEVVRDELAEIERPDGTRRLVSLSAAPMRDDDGRVSGALVTTVDVTERERLLADAEAARAEAEAANRAKSEFLAVMSHELRTPLNAIGGYAELLAMGLRGAVTDQQREDLGRIQRSQRHLLGLINEVLNYAKVEMGVVRYDVADVRVCDVLAAAEGLVAPQAQAKGLTVAVADCDGELAVRADDDKLRQIVVNLLSNAVKFTDAGGRIALSCEAGDDGWVRLCVTDTGVGIPADKLAAIFEPFVQVRSDLTRPAEGAGLGLAISRDLARAMGGDLAAESTPGVGSTFTLTLPVA